MSVASLNNGSLQLSELVISNEKYSNATGYVASSSTFSAGVTGTNLVTSEINIESGANTATLTSVGTDALSINGNQGALFCGEINALGSIDITTGANTATLTSVGTNALSINGNQGALFCGAITAAAAVTANSTLTIGTGSTANSISISGTSGNPLTFSRGILPNVIYDSTNSFGTAGQVPTANGTGGWVWA